MFVKRYLLLEADNNSFPAIHELPYETLKEAFDALNSEFERLVKNVFGKDHVIEYDQKGDAELIDDDGIRYSLVLDGGEDSPSFFVHDGKGTVYTGVLREITVWLNATERERAYREHERQYRLMDAERQLYTYLGYEEDAEEDSEEDVENRAILQQFEDRYGFSLSEAVNDSSDHYLLDNIVYEFDDLFDCNLPENDIWCDAVRNVLEAEVRN